MFAFETKEITKEFGSLVANDRISLAVEKGEVRAILGENGAGKTTLMNILYGLYRPTSGEILVNGRTVDFQSPKDAIAAGLGMVHQHFMLVPTFTVAENILLGMQEKSGIRLSREAINREVKELFDRYGFAIDPGARVSTLPVGIQQRVEIMKAIYRGADILILDEPTAVLIPQETRELFKIIHQLRKEGKSIVFISHKMNEVMEISDNISVLRLGRLEGTYRTSETTTEELCEAMIGRRLQCIANTEQAFRPEVKLAVRDLCVSGGKGQTCKGVSLEVHAGEILGVAGVDGNGQSELGEALTGLRKSDSGQVLVDGKDITNHTPRQIIQAGVAHVPEDRQHRGLLLDFSVKENLILEEHRDRRFSHRGIIDYRKVASHAAGLVQSFRIKTDGTDIPVSSLSGGNQQKVILAREISRDPEVLIIMKPTRGLDVGAIEYVHQTLLDEKARGKAILLFSSELEEIMALSDRIAVMYEGEIAGIVDPCTSTDEIGLMMAGVKRREEGEVAHAEGNA